MPSSILWARGLFFLVRLPDGACQLRHGTRVLSAATDACLPQASPDGTKVLFARAQGLALYAGDAAMTVCAGAWASCFRDDDAFRVAKGGGVYWYDVVKWTGGTTVGLARHFALGQPRRPPPCLERLLVLPGLLVGAAGGRAFVWSEHGKLVRVLLAERVFALGQWLGVAEGSTLTVQDPLTGRAEKTYRCAPYAVAHAQQTARGLLVATRSGMHVRVVNLDTEAETLFAAAGMDAPSFSAEGSALFFSHAGAAECRPVL